ncbi:DNA polymerase [Bacillus pumilus]|uniref:DNA polymerase n=1 Tax=Bacillus pumilus TaxID=1408 RepID=UPI0007EE9F05|nr:DNA polymerase [Bacillus pumilus]OBS85776.1 hypothetical protein BAY68_19345 [Bacillus pumilus]
MARKNKKNAKPIKIMTLDTETRGLFGEVFRVGLYDGNRCRKTNSFKEIQTYIKQYTTDFDVHIFIHNLDFDIAKIAKDILPAADLKDSIFINNVVTVFKSSPNVASTTEENEIVSMPITFHDSSKIVMGSLKKLCKDFGVDERKAKIDLKDYIIQCGWALDIDGNPTNDPNEYDDRLSQGNFFERVDPWDAVLNEYLQNDCIALYEIVAKVVELAGIPLSEFIKCPTAASLAMKVFQYNHPEDYETATSTPYALTKWGEFLEDFIRKGYYGGRTEVFIPFMDKGYHYDINSLYPYVMKTYEIPHGKPRHHKLKKAENIFRYWYNTKQGAGFLECDIHIPHDVFIPPLPHRMFGKLCFPVGNLSGVWTFEEVELALKYGAIIKKVHQCIYFEKKSFIFHDYITYFEEMKISSGGAKKAFAKIMQNSLYGKFGMQRVRQTILPITEKEKCEEKEYPYIELFNPIYGDDFIEAAIPSTARYIQPHIAAYVTSLARIELYNGLMRQLEKEGFVYYCDTDSMVTNINMDEAMVDGDVYGKWKLEGTLDEGIFLQPKTYYEKYDTGETVMKFKGIPSDFIKQLNPDVYADILNRLKEQQKRIENGETISKEDAYYPIIKAEDNERKREKFATMLKMPKEKFIDFDMAREVKKGILLTGMQKRKMDYINNTSTPHIAGDF